MIEWINENGVARVTMTRPGNTHQPDFASAMIRTLDDIVADSTVNAMVLTSSDPKSFSLGIDLEWLNAALSQGAEKDIKAFLYSMNSVFRKLLLLPVPAIAAINGHAFGNGTILACACDFRFMRKDKGFFCFPEVDVSVPFLPGMLGIIGKAVPAPLFNLMALSGARITAMELEKHQVIQTASENQDALIKDAMDFAATFAKKRGIFFELKKRMYADILSRMEKEDPPYIESLKIIIKD